MTADGSKGGWRLAGSSESGDSEAGENPAEALLAEFRLMAREPVPLEMYAAVSGQVEEIGPGAAGAEADLVVGTCPG